MKATIRIAAFVIVMAVICTLCLVSCGRTTGNDITGSWQSDGSTYDYRDGNVYHNGTKLWRYEANDDGSIRIYDGKNGNDYNDYNYTIKGDSMTLGDQTYSRAR